MTNKIFSLPKYSRLRNALLGLTVSFILVFNPDSSQAADTVKGGQLYALHCALCHGVSGISVMPNAPNLAKNKACCSLIYQFWLP